MNYYTRLFLTVLAFSTLAASRGFAQGEVASNKSYAAPKAVVGGNTTEASSQAAGSPAIANAEAPKAPAKPYRTWITVQRYNMEQNGEENQPISNVRLEVTFPNGQKLSLPESGQFWPIGNGQVQEINRNYEIPYAWVSNDGFVFTVQMNRKGTVLLPCKFEVATLSQFNRSYVCRTDTGWQASNHVPAEKHDKESIQIRIFTDLNSKPNEIPNDAIALK